MTLPIGNGIARDHRGVAAGLPFPFTTAMPDSLSILVVDDEAEVLEELTLALGRRGLSVLSAGSARMALALLASRPDVGALITDIRMPGMDGIALAEAALAGRREADALEVLLVTGYASVGQGLAASRVGAFGVLHKPMRGADLARMAAEALASAAARRAAWQPVAPPHHMASAEPMGLPLISLAAREASWTHADVASRPFERRAVPRLADEGREQECLAEGLADELADARALEDGLALTQSAPVSAHALMGQVAARLRALGARCSRRITLQPDADPAFEIDNARLLRAIDLLGRRAFGGHPGGAELSLDAGAGQARLDLLLRPEGAVEAEPRPERDLTLTVARRLVAALGGRLDAWSMPTGGLRVRILLPAE